MIPWLLMGPPVPISIGILFVTLGILSALSHNFNCKIGFLGSMMTIMLTQSLLFVFIIHFTSWRFLPPNQIVHESWLIPILFNADLRLAELGATAAICAIVYFKLVSSRMDLSKAFPGLDLLRPPDHIMRMVEGLADTARIKYPQVQLLDSGTPSTMTVRTRHHHVIVVSVGMLESFNASEIRACLAHEISHIKNRDFLVRSIVTAARIALFAKPLSYFIEAGVYRAREFLADRTAVLLTGDPEPLISALVKLDEAYHETHASGIRNLIYYSGKERPRFRMLSKHPDLETRIRHLRKVDFVNCTKRGDFL